MNGSGPSAGKDNSNGLSEVFYGVMGGVFRAPFGIAMIDKYGLAAGSMARVDVAPAVAHHPASREVNSQDIGRLE